MVYIVHCDFWKQLFLYLGLQRWGEISLEVVQHHVSVLHPLAGVLGCDHGGRPHLGRRPEHRVQGRGGVPQRRLQGNGGGGVPQSHLNLNFNLQCFIIFNEFLHTFNSSLGKLTRPSSTIAGSTPAPTEASSVVSITITGHWIISWMVKNA